MINVGDRVVMVSSGRQGVVVGGEKRPNGRLIVRFDGGSESLVAAAALARMEDKGGAPLERK